MSPRTIAVLGASYGGASTARLLASKIPSGWRVVLVDRNTHANHLYVLPRFGVLPGHEHKAFIPYTNVLKLDTNDTKSNPNIFLCAEVKSLTPNSVTLSQSFPEHGVHSKTLSYEYLIYALGAIMPKPLDLWGSEPGGKEPRMPYHGTKADSIDWLKRNQKVVDAANSVLIVGGGALGIQFATDIKAIHPEKAVTLLHSRKQLLPKFKEEMHQETVKNFGLLGVEYVLGERVIEQTGNTVKTDARREISADLVLLCTGQQPNTSFLRDLHPSTIDPKTKLAHVSRTLQLISSEGKKYENIFVIGDSADAFGAIASGRNAHHQGEVAAKNILHLIEGGHNELEDYEPVPPAIKVSLGLKNAVWQMAGQVGTKDDGVDDLQAPSMWPLFGASPDDTHL